MIAPNTFLIGVQKAATTSFYSWLSQHPDICGPMAMKDYGFFTRDDFYNKGFAWLSSVYEEVFNDEEIILQGSVHYIFFENALRRIQKFNPEAKFILLLRNPVERAISAYEYAVKFNYEQLPINEAFLKEHERMKDEDIQVLSQLTYKHHGLYFRQIQIFLKYFQKEQLKVILFDDITTQPERVLAKTYEFLGVHPDFKPDFKAINNTGEIRNKTFQKVIFGNGSIRNFLVQKVAKRILPHKVVSKMKWKIIHLNTNEKESNYLDRIDIALRSELTNFFKKDIEQLENYLSRDLSHWK